MVENSAETVSALSQVKSGDRLLLAHIAKDPDGTGSYVLEQTTELPVIADGDDISLNYKTVLNAASKEYQDAGDWNGVLLAIHSSCCMGCGVVAVPQPQTRLLAQPYDRSDRLCVRLFY